jgi:hypothetical protein
MIARINSPTQCEMSNLLGISLGSVNNTISSVIKAKLRKKCLVHNLSLEQVEKRRKRSWRLYLKLCVGKWKNFVTTDEAMFYLGGSYGKRRVCYVRKGQIDMDKLKFVKRDSFAPGFMVWAGVSYYGKTSLKFIDRNVKINADYSIKHVLIPFLKHDVPKLFPGNKQKDMVFHQDSASSHTARKSLTYLKQNNVKFISPEEWMPKSLDAASMDFSIWGIVKRRLQKRKVTSLNRLKRALKTEWKANCDQ